MLRVDIVTPTRKLVEGVMASSVKLPAHKGEIEILPGHTDLLTLLNVGRLSFQVDGRERRFALSLGFAEVKRDHVRVLAETAEESKDIDKDRAAKAQKTAQEALSTIISEADFKRYQLKLQRAIVRQQVVQGH